MRGERDERERTAADADSNLLSAQPRAGGSPGFTGGQTDQGWGSVWGRTPQGGAGPDPWGAVLVGCPGSAGHPASWKHVFQGPSGSLCADEPEPGPCSWELSSSEARAGEVPATGAQGLGKSRHFVLFVFILPLIPTPHWPQLPACFLLKKWVDTPTSQSSKTRLKKVAASCHKPSNVAGSQDPRTCDARQIY